MDDIFLKASAAADYIRGLCGISPQIGIVLGSGLGDFADTIESPVSLSYEEIPHFCGTTVLGHSGRLVMGNISGIPIVAMQGRIHAYEGHPINEVTFPIRVLGLLGVETLIVTNAAGGIHASFCPGDLALITDHINFTGTNAAAGQNEPRFGRSSQFGQRFFDMSDAYSPTLRALAVQEAKRLCIALKEGVYLAVLGPSYETPAEIRAFQTLGADLVGMSTVHETIIARHMGLQILGISLVTNVAAGVLQQKIHHDEVIEVGRKSAKSFAALLNALIPQIAEKIPHEK